MGKMEVIPVLTCDRAEYRGLMENFVLRGQQLTALINEAKVFQNCIFSNDLQRYGWCVHTVKSLGKSPLLPWFITSVNIWCIEEDLKLVIEIINLMSIY